MNRGLWIPLHVSIREHPKLLRLARALAVNKSRALGHLAALWTWAQSYAGDGDLSHYEPAEIACGAWWEGDPETFVKALMDAGLLDADMYLHDWSEYGGRVHDQRERVRERVQRYRSSRRNANVEPTEGQDEQDKCNADVTVTQALRNADVTVTAPLQSVTGVSGETQEAEASEGVNSLCECKLTESASEALRNADVTVTAPLRNADVTVTQALRNALDIDIDIERVNTLKSVNSLFADTSRRSALLPDSEKQFLLQERGGGWEEEVVGEPARVTESGGNSSRPAQEREGGLSRSQRELVRRQLQAVFCEASGLGAPRCSTEKQTRAAAVRWWNPLREIAELVDWDADKACDLIREACRRMIADQLTISAPQSVLNVAKSVQAERKRQNSSRFYEHKLADVPPGFVLYVGGRR